MNFVFAVMVLVVEETGVLPTRRCARVWPAAAGAAARWLDPGARAAHVEPDIEAPQGYAFRKLRGLFGVLDDHGMAQAGRAYQIAEWARTHRYCGACGTPAERVAGEFCLRCPACGRIRASRRP